MIVDFLKKYLFGFFSWWYLIKGREVIEYYLRNIFKLFVYLNTGPMLSNLFTPMFQDRSITGRLIAFPIRLTWGLGGLFIELVFGVLGIFLVIFYFSLPVIILYQMVTFLL